MSSKIKVDTIENVAGSGNVSLGSGHNLVVPGNNTTTGNATVGGTLGVTGDATFDTSTLKVDSSNNRVGIGLTAPQELLHLKDGDIAVGNGTASNNAVIGRIGFSTDSSNSRFTGIESFRGSDAANTDLRFHTFAGDSDNGERMRIHNSGAVTKPKTPFVRLSLTSHVSASSTVNSPGNQVTGFTVRENVGSYWNSSNNNFTCPVAGVYQVSVFFIKYPASGTAHVDLHKNGSAVNEVRWRAPEAGSSYYQAGGTVSVTCAANDVLDWHYFGQAGIHDGNGSWEIMLSH